MAKKTISKKIVKKSKLLTKKPAKNLVVKKDKKEKIGEWKEIGAINHYFDKIGVAVVKLKDSLKAGDKIRITGGLDTDFEQEIGSMEFDHKKLKGAKKGQEIGMEIIQKAREGYKVYKSK